MSSYYVYILASKANGAIYIGVTNNLQRRYNEHLKGSQGSFTTQRDAKRLVYFEVTGSIEAAIAREKQLKNWHRQWKINLIESMNPLWWDLGKMYRLDAETSSA
jgi:putative endonuclease